MLYVRDIHGDAFRTNWQDSRMLVDVALGYCVVSSSLLEQQQMIA